MVDKQQAIINFLLQNDYIKNSPLFFNFISAKDDNKQILTTANDKLMNTSYIDGSVLKQYTFTIIDFKSVTYQAIVKQTGFKNENVEEYLDVQGIIDWITEQADAQNYPDFGDDCIIESMEAQTENPTLNGVDTTTTPALAKYSVSVKVQYIDRSKVVWNK